MMTSVAHLCHLFIPAMQDRRFGRVINVASVAGRIPRADGCNYSSSKAYVVALSESLAVTLSGSGVHVTALCPGFTHTEFHESAGMTEMKNSLPRWLWYPAETVVADGLRAVEKAKACLYVPGVFIAGSTLCSSLSGPGAYSRRPGGNVNIVFDLDGTLIDSAPDIRAIANSLLADIGKPGLTLGETRAFIGEGAAVLIQTNDGGKKHRS